MDAIRRAQLRRHVTCHYCGLPLVEADYAAIERDWQAGDGPAVWATCLPCAERLASAFA